MAQGFTLIYDPDVTTYRRVKITTPSAGTAILAGTIVDQYHAGSATVDVVVGTTGGGQGALLAASLTSSLYGVTVETIYAGQTSVLIALITPRQVWSCEASSATTTLTAIAAATLITYIGLRGIPGYTTITVDSASPTAANTAPPYTYTYLNTGTTAGVLRLPSATTAALPTFLASGSDVTGTTGIFILQGTLPAVSTTRVVGRFLTEHAA
jgi:hypothetical protein